MSNKAIYDNLNRVIKAEGIKIDDKDVIKIARASDGNTRVSLQILENYMLNGMNADNAISMCGGMGEELKVDTIEICRIIVGKKQNEWEKVAAFAQNTKGGRICPSSYFRLFALLYLEKHNHERSDEVCHADRGVLRSAL